MSGEDVNDEDYPSASSPEFQDSAQQDGPGFIGPSGFLGRSSPVRWMEEASMRMTVTSLDSNGADSHLPFPWRMLSADLNCSFRTSVNTPADADQHESRQQSRRIPSTSDGGL